MPVPWMMCFIIWREERSAKPINPNNNETVSDLHPKRILSRIPRPENLADAFRTSRGANRAFWFCIDERSKKFKNRHCRLRTRQSFTTDHYPDRSEPLF